MLATVGGQRPKLRFSMALASIVIVLAAAWIFVTIRRPQQEQRAQIHSQPETHEETAQQQPTVTPPPNQQQSPSPTTNAARPVAFLALTVGGVRGSDNGGTQTLIIPHDTTQAQIVLKLKDNTYSRYSISLQKIGGAQIFQQTNIRPRNTKAGASFVFTLPASQLSSGDYALSLTGITPEGETDNLNKSLFRVEKR